MAATTLDVMVLSQNGILKVEGDVRLPDSVRYRAHLEPVSGEAADNSSEESWEAVQALIGFIKDGPSEPIGRDHDQYLYGYSK